MTVDLHATRGFLHDAFRISYTSDIHSPLLSDELPGRSGATITELRLDLALVKSAIRRTLVSDHLIETINAVYSDDPDSMRAVVDCLVAVGFGRRRAFEAVETVKLMSGDGLFEYDPRSREEIKLTGWLDFSLDSLGDEFAERGWI